VGEIQDASFASVWKTGSERDRSSFAHPMYIICTWGDAELSPGLFLRQNIWHDRCSMWKWLSPTELPMLIYYSPTNSSLMKSGFIWGVSIPVILTALSLLPGLGSFFAWVQMNVSLIGIPYLLLSVASFFVGLGVYLVVEEEGPHHLRKLFRIQKIVVAIGVALMPILMCIMLANSERIFPYF